MLHPGRILSYQHQLIKLKEKEVFGRRMGEESKAVR